MTIPALMVLWLIVSLVGSIAVGKFIKFGGEEEDFWTTNSGASGTATTGDLRAERAA